MTKFIANMNPHGSATAANAAGAASPCSFHVTGFVDAALCVVSIFIILVLTGRIDLTGMVVTILVCLICRLFWKQKQRPEHGSQAA